MKTQPTKWDKIFANDMTNMIIAHIFNIKLSIKKTNNSVKKWTEDLNISPKMTYRWPTET